MKLLQIIVFVWCFRQISSFCVATELNTMLCTNEFVFDLFEPMIETLELVNSFIAQKKMLLVFPHVKAVMVRGNMRYEQCKALLDSDLDLIGCEDGNYVSLNLLIIRVRTYMSYRFVAVRTVYKFLTIFLLYINI